MTHVCCKFYFHVQKNVRSYIFHTYMTLGDDIIWNYYYRQYIIRDKRIRRNLSQSSAIYKFYFIDDLYEYIIYRCS